VLMNQTDEPLSVHSRLDVSGAEITGGGLTNGQPYKVERPDRLTVPARGQITDTWLVHVAQSGPVRFKASVTSPNLSDAMEREIPAEPRGIEQLIGVSGKAATGDAMTSLTLPQERRSGSTRFMVHVTPSLALTLLDALPYLADYPYGCTEQTLSRFLPAVIVRQTLRTVGLDAEAAMTRTFGGIDTRRTSPALGQRKNLRSLDDMVQAGLKRLGEMRHADGGWGWWQGGESDPWMTAYVVWGLALARDAGVEIDASWLQGGAAWLRTRLVELGPQPDTLAWALHALAAAHRQGAEVDPLIPPAIEALLARRTELNAYSRALTALALHGFGRADDARALVRNLENGVIRGDAATSALNPGATAGNAPVPTAHWGAERGWRHWSEGGVEATAFALRALLAIDPKHPLVEPVTRWLLNNRRGASWSNTRDTAIVILALNDSLRITGEVRSDLAFAVEVNGREIGTANVTGKAPWEVRSQFEVPPDLVRENNEIRIRRTGGTSPIWFSATARFFNTAEQVKAAGNELFVRRQFFRLAGRPTLLKGLTYDRVPLNDGDAVRSGDRIEAVLTLETKNDTDYVLCQDLKPAGFEAVELRSGAGLTARRLNATALQRPAGRRDAGDYAGGEVWTHAEWRDRRVALFLGHLPEGFWELRYEVRAETPGRFSALPAIAEAMYVPDLRGNSDSHGFTVSE
jgi:alpha-2-macroglobulin